ncbi:MAG: DUF2203 domain-containing protein [bacterium]|nr:DUF2203 domain-containing protein [bacterium]
MKGKIFDRDEVSRMIPLISRIAGDIVATSAMLTRALMAFEMAKARAENDATYVQRVLRCGQVAEKLVDRFRRLTEEVEELGGTVKNYKTGTIDFYGEVDGQIVYLCWQLGEQKIRHWHCCDEDTVQRRPIPIALT